MKHFDSIYSLGRKREEAKEGEEKEEEKDEEKEERADQVREREEIMRQRDMFVKHFVTPGMGGLLKRKADTREEEKRGA